MTHAIKRILWLCLGWAFLVLGVAGLFLPILQGVLFIMIGLVILSSEYVWAHRLLSRLREKFPRLANLADQAKEKAADWRRRVGRSEGAS